MMSPYSLPLILVIAALAVGSPLHANEAPPTTRASIESTLGVFVYPKGDQDAATQDSDSAACYASAEGRTNIDPEAPPAPAAAPNKKRGGAVKGAAGGALRGAALGAIVDEPGDGAALGAAGGAMRGRRAQKRANQEAAQASQEAANAAAEEQKDTFKRAFSACMDARDYSVQ